MADGGKGVVGYSINTGFHGYRFQRSDRQISVNIILLIYSMDFHLRSETKVSESQDLLRHEERVYFVVASKNNLRKSLYACY